MHPELFEIPGIHLIIRSYGLMMVIGFLAAVTIIRYLSRHFTSDPRHITNAALYSLIAGVVGARVFWVVHYYDRLRGDPLGVFAIWNGGLELLGGVLLAVAVIVLYILYYKQPMRHYLDVLAIGLFAALAFGRIGCFLNGCCYGKPTDLPWGVHFPYGSFAYHSQVQPDPQRNRPEPYIDLPRSYFGYRDRTGEYVDDLKPMNELTAEQRQLVTHGEYCSLPVHPTQLYSSAGAVAVGLILLLFLKRSQRAEAAGKFPFLTRPGSVFGLMFIFYAIMRFLVEFIRDDNPFEVASLTIAQLLSVGLFAFGILTLVYFSVAQPERLPVVKGAPAPGASSNAPGRVAAAGAKTQKARS